MNTELQTFKSQTMSSTEIAQLTGKEHKHVLRDIREQLYTGLYGHNFDSPDLGYPLIQGLTAIIDGHTRRTKEIQLDRYHTDILISGYEVKYRAAIVKRWHELESQQPALPETKLEWMMLAVENEKAKQALQNTVDQQNEEIAVLEPKAQALDRLSGADGSMCLTDAAKNLGVQPRKLNKALSMNKWIFKRSVGSHWVAHEDKRQAGYLEHKPCPVKLPNGTEIITHQVRVTANGLAKLAVLVAKWGV